MTDVIANVTPGHDWPVDGDGKTLVDPAKLRAAANPAVTVPLADSVGTADIVDGAVSAAKLAASVADAIVTAVATVGDEDANDITVAVQVKDAQGNALAARCVVHAWISTAEAGAPGALPSGGAPSVDTGISLRDVTDTETGLYMTSTAGALVLTFTEAGALTRYFVLEIGGIVVLGSQSMVWAA